MPDALLADPLQEMKPMTQPRRLATSLGPAGLVALALASGSRVDAADHRDAPGTTADPFADLNDLYAWYKPDTDTIVVVLTFNPLLAPDAPVEMTYNVDELPGVLYTIHIDNDSAPVTNASQWDSQDASTYDSEIDIHVRFGTNALGEWGVWVQNLPGAADDIIGPVEQPLTDGNTSAIAGVFDDPFFFDLTGFNNTLANLDDDMQGPGDLAFRSLLADSNNNDFAGVNTMAIVLEMDAAAALGDNPDSFLQIWATSGRAP